MSLLLVSHSPLSGSLQFVVQPDVFESSSVTVEYTYSSHDPYQREPCGSLRCTDAVSSFGLPGTALT